MDFSTAAAVEVRMSIICFGRVVLTYIRRKDLYIMIHMHNPLNLFKDSIGNIKACEEQI